MAIIPLPSRKKYALPWLLRVANGILAIVAGFAAFRLLLAMIKSPPAFTAGEIGATLFMLLFVGVMLWLFYYGADRATAVIHFMEEGVLYRSLVRKRYLRYDDIAGFQAGLTAHHRGNFFVREKIVIVPNTFRTKGRVIVLQPDMGGHAEILAWLTANFKRFSGRGYIDG